MTQLTDKVKELIGKSRIVSFAEWEKTHPPEAINLFQLADDGGRYLTDEDFQQIQSLSPESSQFIPIAQYLRDNVTSIIDEAREGVLITYPDIIKAGGGLYPPERAAACWRDFWHFLRCITYGIAGSHTEYTSATGLYYMKLLYQELQVPLDAMVLGLEGIKAASLKRCDSTHYDTLSLYFDHLISKMKGFQG
jgi:hypothetical protein